MNFLFNQSYLTSCLASFSFFFFHENIKENYFLLNAAHN